MRPMSAVSGSILLLVVFVVKSSCGYNTWADNYHSMGDIDWGKRSGGYYDNWISPAYSYSSMADGDWGWKKRAVMAPLQQVNENVVAEEEEQQPAAVEDQEDDEQDQLAKWRSLYYNIYRPTPAVMAQPVRRSPYGRYGRSLMKPRQYQYRSMADMDWGWKKRSPVAPLVGVMRAGDRGTGGSSIVKKHIGSVGQNTLSKYHPVKTLA